MLDGGQRVPLDLDHLKGLIVSACQSLGADVKPDPIMAETMRNLYDGVPMDEVYKASILAARTLIEKDPDYTYATARLLLHTIFKEVLGRDLPPAEMAQSLRRLLPRLHQEGRRQRAAGREAAAVRPEEAGRRAQGRTRPEVRLPGPADPVRPLLPARAQDAASSCPRPSSCAWPWACALNEIDREARAIEFYEVLSSFDFMSRTPTLFNAARCARSCPPAT